MVPQNATLANELRECASMYKDSIDLSGVRLMGKAPWNNVYNIPTVSERLMSLALNEEE